MSSNYRPDTTGNRFLADNINNILTKISNIQSYNNITDDKTHLNTANLKERLFGIFIYLNIYIKHFYKNTDFDKVHSLDIQINNTKIFNDIYSIINDIKIIINELKSKSTPFYLYDTRDIIYEKLYILRKLIHKLIIAYYTDNELIDYVFNINSINTIQQPVAESLAFRQIQSINFNDFILYNNTTRITCKFIQPAPYYNVPDSEHKKYNLFKINKDGLKNIDKQ